MIALPSLVGDDEVPCSRHVFRGLLPLRGPSAVHALWLDWTLLLLRDLGGCRDYVDLRGAECHGLPGFVESPLGVTSVWSVVPIPLSGVD